MGLVRTFRAMVAVSLLCLLAGEELINCERTYYVRGVVGGEALAGLLDSPVPEGERANAGLGWRIAAFAEHPFSRRTTPPL